MNIGQAAKQSGLLAETLRYYEDIGLLVPVRSANGYRSYSEMDIRTLQLMQKLRSLGFSVDDCRAILSMTTRQSLPDEEFLLKLSQVDDKIAVLNSIRAAIVSVFESSKNGTENELSIADALS